MPLAHRKLAAWYHQLAQHLEAGLTLGDALHLSKGSGAPSKGLDAIARTIESGGSIDAALEQTASWLPLGDRLFLAAAASAGRMPRTLHALSARHAQLHAAKVRSLLACLYPAAVLHLGLLLLPVMHMIDWEKGFTWDFSAYLRELALTLLPLWGAAILIYLLIRGQNPLLAGLANLTPFIGRYVRARALSEFAFALANFLEAGVPIDRAWALAGAISTSRKLTAAAGEMGPVIARGEPPGPRLVGSKVFPPDFAALYRSGEISGQLEQNLARLSVQYQAEAQRALSLATIVYPGIMFLVVAAGVGYFVITIYGGYLKMLTSLADGS